MKQRVRFAVNVIVFVVFTLYTSMQASADTIDLESLSMYTPGSGNSYYNGNPVNTPPGFVSQGVSFNNEYNATFDSWSEWSYSNVMDSVTPGMANQYAAYPGSGAGGSAQYGVAYYTGFPPLPTVTFGQEVNVASADITNTTYTALSLLNGDTFAKQFGGTTGNDPDFLLLTVTGLDNGLQTGSVDFYLADYRFTNNTSDYVVASWETVDLSSLGTVDSLQFTMASSDIGPFGINTPTYFALDNLTFVSAVPEPSSLALGAFAILGFCRFRKSRCLATVNGK